MITVMFDCKGCGIQKHKVQVPARTVEDVVEWVRRVGDIVGEEHRKLSPNCTTAKCDLYLPTTGEFIGQQVE